MYKVNPRTRLSSLRSSLEEETLVNAGHVANRFWKRASEGGRVGSAC